MGIRKSPYTQHRIRNVLLSFSKENSVPPWLGNQGYSIVCEERRVNNTLSFDGAMMVLTGGAY
jgi:hypothetical protein